MTVTDNQSMEVNVRTNDKGQDTKTRLLHSAGDLFAAKGFKGATIRDICDKVGANLASVH